MDLAPKLLFTRKESAVTLSISEWTLDHLILSGQLKCVRIGRKVLVHRNELERFASKDHPRPVRSIRPADKAADRQLRLA